MKDNEIFNMPKIIPNNPSGPIENSRTCAKCRLRADLESARAERDKWRTATETLDVDHQRAIKEAALANNENARIRAALSRVVEAGNNLTYFRGITELFEALVREADNIAGGRWGMQVPFHDDFGAALQLPSCVDKFRWWAKELRRELDIYDAAVKDAGEKR